MRKQYRYLRRSRITVAVLFAAAIVGGAVAPVPVLRNMGVLARDTQLVPALMATSLGWLIFWGCVTLLFGRIYCSTACPMGTLQDVVSRLTRKPFRAADRHVFVRIFAFFIFTESIAIPYSLVTWAMDPYTDFLRALMLGNLTGWTAITAAAAILLIVGICSSGRRGRLICNTVCPVGSVLGVISSVSLLQFDIDPDACTHCGLCEKVCKSRCIDSLKSTVDNPRCVVCFNCVDVCPDDAIFWRKNRHRLRWPLMQKTQAAMNNVTPTSNETIS